MRPNPGCWFEIYVSDLPRAVAFYETVLGTKLEKLESPVPEIEMMAFPMSDEIPGASGALCHMDGVKGGAGGTMIYFACDDCGVEASRIESAGGRIEKPKTSIGPYGYVVMAVDPEGNPFGLHTTASQTNEAP